jgi:beta-galactosidase
MVTRRDLIRMGALAVTSASCTQIGHANGARLADLDWDTTSDQRPIQSKWAKAKKDPKSFTAYEDPEGDPRPLPSVTVVNPVFRSSIRDFESLDGQWEFALDPESIGFDEEWFDKGGSFSRMIQVPSAWPTQGVGEPGMSHPTHIEGYAIPLRNQYVGSGWYRKILSPRPEWRAKQVWLKIGGVNSQAWFWLNGKYLGHLNRSCGAYKFDLTPRLQDSDNTLVIWVSNRALSKKGLLNWQDQFGGFYRSVELEATSTVYIDDVWARPDFDNHQAHFEMKLTSAGKAAAGNYRVRVAVTTLPDSQPAGEAQMDLTEIAERGNEISLPVSLNPFRSWSPEEPALYRADLVLEYSGQSIDGWVERFGVSSIERRGSDILLNGKKTFLLGFGDDYVYPLTIASPPSRNEHLAHLKLARSYGFNFIRLHSGVESPEYFEAAEEAGMMIQPSLPYEGNRPATRDGCYSPLDDLNELIHNYRRYASLIAYCMGNEGFHHPETQSALYRFSKMMDPTRLVRAQDGVVTDYEGISDIHGGPPGRKPVEQAGITQTMPVVLHEYLNLSGPPDYRLAPLFTGAESPPYEKLLDRPWAPDIPSTLLVQTRPKPLPRSDANGQTDLGISVDMAERVIDAGHEFQSIYQKIGLERARSMKGVTGYNYWTIVDVSALMPQGLLDMFWRAKRSTPEYFRQFNSPVVVLLPDISPYGTDRVLTSGGQRSYRIACSNYGSVDLSGTYASWSLVLDGKTLSHGLLEKVRVPQGEIADMGTLEVTMPDVTSPAEVWLRVQLGDGKAQNSWQFYCFPKNWTHASLRGAFATAAIYGIIRKEYPEVQLLKPETSTPPQDLMLTDRLDKTVLSFAAGGGTAVLLGLSDFAPLQPGVQLGWWGPSNQRGTVMARSKAFGDFPSKDGMPSLAIFGLLRDAVLLEGQLINHVEPLMVTLSERGYSVSVFETRLGAGRLFATGLNLLSGNPEGSYLLDQFVSYVRSRDFAPKKSISLPDLNETIRRSSAAAR